MYLGGVGEGGLFYRFVGVEMGGRGGRLRSRNDCLGEGGGGGGIHVNVCALFVGLLLRVNQLLHVVP